MARAPHDTAKRLSEYETYLHTEELLSLQKSPEELSHHDELQFQVVHQTFELWWKEAEHDLTAIQRRMQSGEYLEAARLLRRVAQIEQLLLQVLAMLEMMTPWDFLTIRSGLGHGSGMDSPGFRKLMRLSPRLWDDFTQALAREGLSLADLYIRRTRSPGLFEVAEGLLNYDENFQLFRSHHFRLIERMLGPDAVGTGGTPMLRLANTLNDRFYPELWKIRNTLTQRAAEHS
jgi:tryptophan 2,3-dioxygenase